MGSVVDAMSGYAAMFISYLAMGVAASYRSVLGFWKPEWLLVLGALSGAFVIFPRLVMHKAINTVQAQESQQLKGRKNFGLAEVIALNLTSISGMPQVFMLIAILLGWNDLFTVGYFLLNGLVMILSLRKVLR